MRRWAVLLLGGSLVVALLAIVVSFQFDTPWNRIGHGSTYLTVEKLPPGDEGSSPVLLQGPDLEGDLAPLREAIEEADRSGSASLRIDANQRARLDAMLMKKAEEQGVADGHLVRVGEGTYQVGFIV